MRFHKQMVKIHISFSAGETSAWMTYYLLRVYYKCIYREDLEVHEGADPESGSGVHIIVTFANTGQENEETLIFAKKCDDQFGFRTVWLEAVPLFYLGKKLEKCIDHLLNGLNLKWFGGRRSTVHKLVDFDSANRDGAVFESTILRYGIPNSSNPSCTRELKLRPMQSYLKSRGWEKGSYYTAIGLRSDEIDRIHVDYKKLKLIYPAISIKPMTKPMINGFWVLQPFRLKLKGYEGNCKWCHKKGLKKLWTLTIERPEYFDFPRRMEEKYGEYITPDRIEYMEKKGLKIPEPGSRNYVFFRNNRSVEDLFEEAKTKDLDVDDDSLVPESESCEVYSNCGNVDSNEQ